ncbi:conjugal transfer protein TraG N-terminal domain-containing protein [Aliarcobacter cryaerophilus]|uniref:conjugal transfer protein TraG N-terminal domain-containing protein n=1 Tax=Aliarcobacter cryaerophilus TaxID=28198 RepID=UPI0013DDD40D|nr:conjugal transfer protein TraG N-terminal domain-containing protein [Aliarcobacter cryaerophilus]
MKKILTILVALGATLFADDGWWIYTYEDVSTLKAVFNYLAMIKTDSGFLATIQTVLIAGLTFTIIFKFLDIAAIPKYLLSVVGTMLIVFSTTTTVMISNVKSYDSFNSHVNSYAVVDNVPFIFAVLSSAFSSVGYNSALLIETIFSNVTSTSDTTQASFLKTGNLGAWKILDALDSIDALAISSDGKEFAKNFDEYLQLCVNNIGIATDSRIKDEIRQATDILVYLSPTSSPNEYIQNLSSQKVINSEGNLTTCGSLYNKAYSSFSTLRASGIAYDKANSLVSKITSNVDGAASTVAKMMTGSGLASAQANINNYILMTGVRKAFESSWQSYGIGASSAQAGFGAGLAEANLQAQGKVKAKSAATMMPSIHSVLQAVMYVLFPLVLIVQLFAGGFKILQNYILGILWLELWIPSYSVLNYFTLKEAQEQAYDKLVSSTASSGPEGMLTLVNQNEIYNTIANQAAIAADFYIVGIPALAGFILFASFQALSGITSGVANVVGQYSNNQTLNQERANLAALDNVNQQMKLNNPLYTGNVGTVQAMIAQEGSISQASKAAASFLASGSNLENFSNITKGNMFRGLEQTTSDIARQQTLNNGGGLTNGLDVSKNLGDKKAFEDRGVSYSINKNSNMLNMMGSNSESSTTYDNINKNSKFDNLGSNLENVAIGTGRKDAQTSLGEVKAINSQSNSELQNAAETSQITSVADHNATKKHLEKNFGDLETGANSVANVNKGSQIRGVKEQIGVAGGEGNLIGVNSTQAAGKIAEEQSKQEMLNSNGGYLNNMADKGTFDGAQVKGKNQALNEIGEKAIIQDSKVKTITSAAGSEAELNALDSMKKAGLLDKDTSLYDKKVSDGGNFVAVDKEGNKITIYTDSKGNILGYEKQTIDPNTKDGGAGVKTIHASDGRILAKTEDGSTQKNYQNTKDLRFETNYTMENKGAAYAGLNEKLRQDISNAKNQEEKENIVKKFLEDTVRADVVLNPVDTGKVITKETMTGYLGEAIRQNLYDDIVSDRGKNIDSAIFDEIKDIGESLAKNVPGGAEINKAIQAVDRFFESSSKETEK